jgi:hypothetical protein
VLDKFLRKIGAWLSDERSQSHPRASEDLSREELDRLAKNLRWDDPSEFVTARRFDLGAKHLYARCWQSGAIDPWAGFVYSSHLNYWNRFFEESPRKEGVEDFTRSFDGLLSATRDAERGLISIVPTLKNRTLLNGGHRTAAALALGKKILTTTLDVHPDHGNYDHRFFKALRDEHGAEPPSAILDAMALEFVHMRRNLAIAVRYPAAVGNDGFIEDVLAEYGSIYYDKNIHLTEHGAVNLILELYAGESWLGSLDNAYRGAKEKASRCWGAAPGTAKVYLYEYRKEEDLLALKARVRERLRLDKDSFHISNPGEESRIISHLLLTDSCERFLNERRRAETPNFDRLCREFKSVLPDERRKNLYCIDGGAVLAAWGMRDCTDLDYIHISEELHASDEINSHNSYAHHYPISVQEIVSDPRYHFYHRGVRFVALPLVLQWKRCRGEIKDVEDVALIERQWPKAVIP